MRRALEKGTHLLHVPHCSMYCPHRSFPFNGGDKFIVAPSLDHKGYDKFLLPLHRRFNSLVLPLRRSSFRHLLNRTGS